MSARDQSCIALHSLTRYRIKTDQKNGIAPDALYRATSRITIEPQWRYSNKLRRC